MKGLKRVIGIVLFFSALLAFGGIAYGQTVITAGNVNQMTKQLGGYAADSLIAIPYRDTTASSWTSFRLAGRLTVRPQDGLMYIHDGTKWKALASAPTGYISYTDTLRPAGHIPTYYYVDSLDNYNVKWGGDARSTNGVIGTTTDKTVTLISNNKDAIKIDNQDVTIYGDTLPHLTFKNNTNLVSGQDIAHVEFKDSNDIVYARIYPVYLGTNDADRTTEINFAVGHNTTMPNVLKLRNEHVEINGTIEARANAYNGTDSINLLGRNGNGNFERMSVAQVNETIGLNDSLPIYATYFKNTLLTTNFTNSSYGSDGNRMVQMGKYWYSIGRWNGSMPHDHDSLVVWGPVGNLSIRDTAFAPWHGRHGFSTYVNATRDSLFIWGGDFVDAPVYAADDVWVATQDTITGALTWYLVQDNVQCLQRVFQGGVGTPRGLCSFGGQKDANATDTMFTDFWFSADWGVTWTRLSNNLPVMGNIATNCVYLDGYIYIISGGNYDPLGTPTYNKTVYRIKDDGLGIAELYDTIPFPARQYPVITTYNGYICVGMGGTVSGWFNDLWLYKPSLKQWREISYDRLIQKSDAGGFTSIIDSNGFQSLLMAGGTGSLYGTSNRMYWLYENGLSYTSIYQRADGLTGTNKYIQKSTGTNALTDATTLGNSVIYEDADNISIGGTNTASAKVTIVPDVNLKHLKLNTSANTNLTFSYEPGGAGMELGFKTNTLGTINNSAIIYTPNAAMLAFGNNIKAGTNTILGSRTASEAMLIFTTQYDKSFVWYENATTVLGTSYATATYEKMRLQSGELLIGTLTDLGNYKLQVAGPIKISPTNDAAPDSIGTYVNGASSMTDVANLNQTAYSVSSAGTLGLTATTTIIKKRTYIFSGTTSTYTLPTLASSLGGEFVIVNRGSGTITLNSNAGGNDIYPLSTGVATNTISIPTNTTITLFDDGTYFIAR